MTRPTTLADRFRDPRAVGGAFDDKLLRKAMEMADRMVLDDAATALAVQMSTATPLQTRRMLDQLEIPERPIWLEMSSAVMLRERVKQGGMPDPEEALRRDPTARTAMLIRRGEDVPGEIHTWCIEDVEAKTAAEVGSSVMVWPIGMVLSPGKLLDDARLGVRNPESDTLALGDQSLLDVAGELAGWARLTVATLAMLQTVTLAGPPIRAPGHFRSEGRLKPHLEVRPLSVSVPHRIRNPVAYARKRLAEAAQHRRLHEVRAHYRHLDHQPRASGWQPVQIEGQTFWRKRIDGHLRGDPSLGVVEHDLTVVHGPKMSARTEVSADESACVQGH